MTKSEEERKKWGFWDITDEQAERINSGDVDEFNSFFVRNYAVIENLCYDKLKKISAQFHSEKDVHDIINAFYYDLRFAKFENGALLCHLLYLSARSVDRSSYQIARKLSPKNLEDCFNHSPYFQSMEYENSSDHGENFCIVDLYETAPSPQEEIQEETRQTEFLTLLSSIEPLVDGKAVQYLPFYLNGIRPRHASQRLKSKNDQGSTMYKNIERSLIQNYDTVLTILQNVGYTVPTYLLHETPPRYDEVMRPTREREAKRAERERKEIEEKAEKERKAQERAERAKTAKERNKAYNKAYTVMKRYGETLEEHEARRKAEAEAKQRQKELAQLEKERKAQERAERHLQSLEKRREYRKAYYANKRANETPEEREKRLESMRQYAKRRYSDGIETAQTSANF